MVPNVLIHEALIKKFNKITSNFNSEVNVEEWDSYFNEATRAWFKERVADAKINNKVRFDLRKLEVAMKPVEIIDKANNYIMVSLPENYYNVLAIYPTASIEGCGKRNLIVKIVQGDEWPKMIDDPYTGPSYLWSRTIADEVGAGLRIGIGDFNIESVKIDYYRLPAEIYSPELQECEYNGALKVLGRKNIPFELDKMQADEICDIAIYFVCRDKGDPGETASQYEKVMNMYKNK